MPPRYAYWTIIIDNAPTAFRARDRAELMGVFRQLAGRNPTAVMKWFAHGRLWNSPEEAHAAARSRREARGPDWRPGGKHQDPRARFTKRERPEGRGGPRRDDQQPRPDNGREGPRGTAGPPRSSRGQGDVRPDRRGQRSGGSRDRKRHDRAPRKPWEPRPRTVPHSRTVLGSQPPGDTNTPAGPEVPPPPEPPGPERPPKPGHEPPPDTPPPETIKILPEPPERAAGPGGSRLVRKRR